jgi:3-hydroxyisobutyrate dehydrogenase-like beta-hydroxyacid dehydrogenase
MKTTEQSKKISVIGLGQMGRKIAQLYLEAGFEVTGWNRTKAKAKDLNNIILVDDVSEAIKRSPISIICVYDNNGTLEILQNIQDKSILLNKTIVNFTTGSPKEAAEIETIVTSQTGIYINGAIQVAPDQMGLESTTILLAGNAKVYDQNKAILDVLGGNLKYLSETPSAASAMDLATLTLLYGSYIGLIYAVKLCQEYDLNLEDFSAIVGEVSPGYTDFFKYEIDVIKRGDFTITQSPLPISVASTKRIAESFKELKVLQEFPKVLANILNKADREGLSNEELAAIIKVISTPEH